jgi:hypothetical protein
VELCIWYTKYQQICYAIDADRWLGRQGGVVVAPHKIVRGTAPFGRDDYGKSSGLKSDQEAAALNAEPRRARAGFPPRLLSLETDGSLFPLIVSEYRPIAIWTFECRFKPVTEWMRRQDRCISGLSHARDRMRPRAFVSQANNESNIGRSRIALSDCA